MKFHQIELSEETVKVLKEKLGLKTDGELRKRLQYWVKPEIERILQGGKK